MTKPDKESADWTYQDYCSWPDEERWELIDGEAFMMTPAPSTTHQRILADLTTQFHNFLREKECIVFPSPVDVLLPRRNEKDGEVNTVVQPDLIVVCDRKKIDEKKIRGAPDLVVEVLSPSSASRDAIRKRRRYEEAGVKEFWMVHPSDFLVTVFYLEENKTFGKPLYFFADQKIAVSVLPGCEINLTTVFSYKPRIVKESPKVWSQ